MIRKLERRNTGNHSLTMRSWTDVVRGAVVRGVEMNPQNAVVLRACPRNYGVVLSEEYSAFSHESPDSHSDPFDGLDKAREQIIWPIKKGDMISSKEPILQIVRFKRRFGVEDPKIFITPIYAYVGEDLPTRYQESRSGIFSLLSNSHSILTQCRAWHANCGITI